MNLNVGKPVSGNELIGREREVDEIIRTLKAGQSVALIAPRRFGKTSIMMEVQNRLSGENYYTGNVDLFTVPDIERLAFEITRQVLSNRRLDEAFKNLKDNLTGILKNIEFRKEIEGAEFILGFGKPQKDYREQLTASIKYIDEFAIRHKKRICFAFDEFGDISKLDGIGIIKLFRGIIQGQKQSVFIFSGSFESVMNKLFVSSKAPFYRMVKIIQPGFIDKNSLILFIRSKFKSLNIPPNNKDIHDGIEFTKGHPYYVRLFIQEYYFNFLQNHKPPQLALIFENMLMTEINYLEKLWDEISKKRETRLVLIKIIETGKPYTGSESKGINISRAINELIGKGILFTDGSVYSVSDPLLERFIKLRVLKLPE
jgi:uncharacterized protein